MWVAARDAAAGRAAADAVGGRFVQLDVTDPKQVRAAAATVGELDVLVNNAGINTGGYDVPSRDDPDLVRTVYDTNVFGVVRVTNAFLPPLRRSAAGRIVNVSSMRGSLGEDGAWVGQPSMPYSSSKTALNAVTAHYARELAASGITVNAVSPGHVATDFNGFRGTRSVEEGAAGIVTAAFTRPGGPSGTLAQDGRRLAW